MFQSFKDKTAHPVQLTTRQHTYCCLVIFISNRKNHPLGRFFVSQLCFCSNRGLCCKFWHNRWHRNYRCFDSSHDHVNL